MHFYVYGYSNGGQDGNPKGYYYYERTCGTEDAAKERVKYLGGRAVYLAGFIIRNAFY